jgi:hypothetical protein
MNIPVTNNKKIQLHYFLFSFCLIAALGIYSSVNAQQDNSKTFGVYPGFGFGIGYFNPKQVNVYIADNLPDNIYMQYGSTDIFLYEELHVFVTCRIKWMDITSLVDYALGPKFIVISGSSSQFYNFNRISPGLLVNFYIPTHSSRHSFFIGGGAQFHIMKFEEYGGNAIGYRANAGYNIQLRKIGLQPNIAFNLAKAEDDRDFYAFELNYTGLQIGLNVSFHKPIAYR